jgi:glycosyltransferase involved in cell wall biosynthesis
VLYVGRIVKEKGVLVLADALRLADRSGLALRACFVGEGDATAPLRDVASHFSHVTVGFPGRLGGPSLARAYCASAVTVLPTLPDSPGSQFTLEGMGLVLAESFFAGLPVVASDLPTIREVVGDGGLLFTPGDPVELCEKLQGFCAGEHLPL